MEMAVTVAVVEVEMEMENGNGGNDGGKYDPAYPDDCIPSPPPDLDCKDSLYVPKNVKVLPPDPHRLDNDND
jgi:hypothetical protein